MPLDPYVQPARPAVEYPGVRLSRLTITQGRVGGPVDVGYRLDRYRVTEAGAEDAPEAAADSAVVRYTVADLQTDAELAQVVAVLTARAEADAVYRQDNPPPINPTPPVE